MNERYYQHEVIEGKTRVILWERDAEDRECKSVVEIVECDTLEQCIDLLKSVDAYDPALKMVKTRNSVIYFRELTVKV